MQNKGIVICVAVLLTLASIFYLSFSFATRYYDSEAAKIKDPIAQQDYKDSVKYLGVYSYQNCLETQIGLGLDLKGGILRIDGKIVAFTIGEPICPDTFVVHIEKAYADVPGAYTMINQQFVEHECMDYKYVNREDDAGSEGLRKAKLSYKPVFMVEKGHVHEKEIEK